jgi:hypothetical protein
MLTTLLSATTVVLFSMRNCYTLLDKQRILVVCYLFYYQLFIRCYSTTANTQRINTGGQFTYI